VRLREAVGEQRPPARPVRVADELDCDRLVRHVTYCPAAGSSLSTCENEPMTVARLLTQEDVPALAELYPANRDFLAPFEPVRSEE
jgi:hypothetical protein